MAKNIEKTPTRRTKIFIVEAAQVVLAQEIVEKTAASSSIRRDPANPESFSSSVGRRRLRDEYDAIWHSR